MKITSSHCEHCGAEFSAPPWQFQKGRRFCSTKCSGLAHILSPQQLIKKHTGCTTDTGCVLWAGHRDAAGYGIAGRAKAHRLAWIVANGPIPDGLCICHHCDNPPCINPAHLFLGTICDNNVDRMVKDRGTFGERVHTARLTVDQVTEIRKRHAMGAVGPIMLAKEYGVAEATIFKLLSRRSWRRVI